MNELESKLKDAIRTVRKVVIEEAVSSAIVSVTQGDISVTFEVKAVPSPEVT